ncbi:bifunctional pantoate--beta-alanine ligase/(d)CMP kinase [Myxosarcina sp. GI1]|uniref:bifunctional pantoate--beta-alanine ligase/(d)CMP kinase n=1 Tax=Myxosarcina sp. GI1 TaxID=1541065 RepID=UPI00056897FB
MLVIKTIAELRSYLASRHSAQIGLVPTMGALHQGHLSLIERAIAETDTVVVSIFVNPLQFAPTEDLQQYPRQLEADFQLCQRLGVDVVFAPTVEAMNLKGDSAAQSLTTTVVPPADLITVLCGKFRSGHFEGVATIVTKLFNIVRCNRAYFGQKDAQQLAIIRQVVADLNIPVEIVGCPIVREASGLALSSRNQYLTADQKESAAQIYQGLLQAQAAFKQGENHSQILVDLVKQKLTNLAEVKIQYIELVHPQTLKPLNEVKQQGLLAIAAHVGSTRLIDNILLKKRQPIIAIDGPAGAGKSTVTRRVAQKLKLLYLDTGAMYRAVTWLVMQSNLALDNEEAIADLVEEAKIELIPPDAIDLPTGVYINKQDVTQTIRTPEVTANVSTIAAQAAVREALVSMQQKWGFEGGVIAEGRDIGTNVFPDAELKIFLTASAAERAKRRSQDLARQGESNIDLEQLTREIRQRDEKDSNRAIAPLKKAPDAIELVTDDLSIDVVTQKIVELYRERID